MEFAKNKIIRRIFSQKKKNVFFWYAGHMHWIITPTIVLHKYLINCFYDDRPSLVVIGKLAQGDPKKGL